MPTDQRPSQLVEEDASLVVYKPAGCPRLRSYRPYDLPERSTWNICVT